MISKRAITCCTALKSVEEASLVEPVAPAVGVAMSQPDESRLLT